MSKEKELEVFNFIKSRLSEGISPSVREIMDAVGFKSTSTAHRYINALIDEGLIEKTSSINRSVRLPNSSLFSVPIVNTAVSDRSITDMDNITGYTGFEAPGCDPNNLFALRVNGDSMINAGMLDGDLVVVKSTERAENGDIVVALIDGEEATIKRFFKEDGCYRLQPENDTMDPIIVDECEILGKVIGLKRYY